MKKKKKVLRKNKSKARQARQRARVQRLAVLAFKVAGTAVAVPVMALGFIFAHDLITQADTFNAQTIRITGHRHLSDKQVLELAGIEPGQNILSVNLWLARKRLISHGWIAEAAVKRKLPDGLEIDVREHVPAAVIATGPGFLMDARGRAFKKLMPGESGRLPVVSGLAYTDIAVGRLPETPLMQAVMELLEISRKSAAVLPGKRLKKIRADRETGLTLTLSGRLATIKVGYAGYAEKLHMLDIISQYAERSDSLAAIESVDLNNINRIVLGPVVPVAPAANNKEV